MQIKNAFIGQWIALAQSRNWRHRCSRTGANSNTPPLKNKVINTNMPIHANLSVCDMSDEAAAQIYEDLRKVAVLNVKDRGYTVHNPEDLACSFSVLPQI